MKIRLSKTQSILLIFNLFVILPLSIYCRVNILFTICFLVWAQMFILSLAEKNKNMVFVFFLLAFFVFLMGREFCFAYFELKRYYLFTQEINNHAYLCLIISMLGIAVGYTVHGKAEKMQMSTGYVNINVLQKVSFFAFILCSIFQYVSVYYQIIAVRKVGYVESYVENAVSGLPSYVSYFAAFTNVAVAIYLATKPKKNQCILVLSIFEIYAILSLFTGKRYPFIAISMYIYIYVIKAKNRKGMDKKVVPDSNNYSDSHSNDFVDTIFINQTRKQIRI